MLIFMSCQEKKFDSETTLNLVTPGANNLAVLALYYVQFPQFSSPAQTTKYVQTVYPIPVVQCYNCWGPREIEPLRFLKGMDNQTLAALTKDWWALDANRGPLSLLSADPSSVWTGVGFCQSHTQEQPGTECPLQLRLHARRPLLGSLHSGTPSYKILVYLSTLIGSADSFNSISSCDLK